MNRWDERYRAGERSDSEPAPVVLRAAKLHPPGRALDLACGPGRHALLLASLGWDVTAVDSSQVALEMLKERAASQGLSVDARLADLEAGEFTIEPAGYDIICDCFFLHRELFDPIRAGIRPGGLVAAAFPMVGGPPGASPMNPNYLLHPGELRALLDGLTLLHYFEGREDGSTHARPVAEAIAQK
ncbi:MAG: class I SAM-dependent methyltransferase [Bryobacteraceae bacterium]